MKKSIGSIFIAYVFLMVSLSGCAPAPTPAPVLPTFTPSISSTSTPESISRATTANPITSVKIYLPERYKWDQITNQSVDNQYNREWVPEGSTGLDTKWIIVDQKFVIDSPVSAEEFLGIIFTLAKDACTDVLYNGPDKIEVNGHETYVGRFMCAEQMGMGYGVFTDQRVAVQGNEVYVITSELRLPSSPKAGIVSFPENQTDEMEEFMELQELSAEFVRDFVEICTVGNVDC